MYIQRNIVSTFNELNCYNYTHINVHVLITGFIAYQQPTVQVISYRKKNNAERKYQQESSVYDENVFDIDNCLIGKLQIVLFVNVSSSMRID